MSYKYRDSADSWCRRRAYPSCALWEPDSIPSSLPATGLWPRCSGQPLPSAVSDEELITAARERAAGGQEPSATWLIKTYGIGTGRAARIRDAVPQLDHGEADPSGSAPELQLVGGEA